MPRAAVDHPHPLAGARGRSRQTRPSARPRHPSASLVPECSPRPRLLDRSLVSAPGHPAASVIPRAYASRRCGHSAVADSGRYSRWVSLLPMCAAATARDASAEPSLRHPACGCRRRTEPPPTRRRLRRSRCTDHCIYQAVADIGMGPRPTWHRLRRGRSCDHFTYEAVARVRSWWTWREATTSGCRRGTVRHPDLSDAAYRLVPVVVHNGYQAVGEVGGCPRTASGPACSRVGC